MAYYFIIGYHFETRYEEKGGEGIQKKHFFDCFSYAGSTYYAMWWCVLPSIVFMLFYSINKLILSKRELLSPKLRYVHSVMLKYCWLVIV